MHESEGLVYDGGRYPARETVETGWKEGPLLGDRREGLDTLQILLSSHPAHSEDLTLVSDDSCRSPSHSHLTGHLPHSTPQRKSFQINQNIF